MAEEPNILEYHNQTVRFVRGFSLGGIESTLDWLLVSLV